MSVSVIADEDDNDDDNSSSMSIPPNAYTNKKKNCINSGNNKQ